MNDAIPMEDWPSEQELMALVEPEPELLLDYETSDERMKNLWTSSMMLMEVCSDGKGQSFDSAIGVAPLALSVGVLVVGKLKERGLKEEQISPYSKVLSTWLPALTMRIVALSWREKRHSKLVGELLEQEATRMADTVYLASKPRLN